VWWLFGWCWGSRATIIIHNGFDCSGTFYSNWDILQCIGGNHGRPTDMATSLSHTCKKDVNKGVFGLLSHLLRIWCIAIVCWFFAATQLINQASFIPMIFAISPFSCHFIYEEKIY
jgi:hypothetical protein